MAGEGWGEGISQHPSHQALLWFALWQCAHSLYRSTLSMQISGVHGISSIIDNFDRFTVSVALHWVLAARTATTRSPCEPARYVLRSCQGIFLAG